MDDAIEKSKRILALVDKYHENPTAHHRTALRIALHDEFTQLPAQSSQVKENAFPLHNDAVKLKESAGADAVDAKIAMLTNAIEITLRENAHLADGEDCTLIHLKRAIAAQSTEGAKG